MRVLAVVATFLGGASAARKEAVNLQKSGTATEIESAQRASVAAKRDLFSARAEFDALVEEAQLPSGVQIPPGWVVINTPAKLPVPPVATPAQKAPAAPVVVQPPLAPRALVAAPGTTVVSSGVAKVIVDDKPSSTPQLPPQAFRPAAIPRALPQKPAPVAPATRKLATAVPPAIPRALPQQRILAPGSSNETQKGNQTGPNPVPAPAPCWDPAPVPAPAGAPAGGPAGPADAAADELNGAHGKTPEDDYVPALEGVLVPPSGEATPVTSAQAVVPPNTLSKIQSVECLEKTLENPEYKCADHHYVGGAPPPQAAVQQDTKKETKTGASAADIEAINDAVKKAEHAAADAKAEAAMAEKYFNDAKAIAARVAKKDADKKDADKKGDAVNFLRHPTKRHHHDHHEVSSPKHMPILIHAKSPVVFHDKKPQM